MGGRGSAFKRTSGKSISEDWFDGWNEEDYTKLPTKNTDFLKEKKDVWVMDSTDVINRSTMNKQSDFIKELTTEYKGSTELLDSTNNLRIRSMKMKSNNTYAAFVFPGNHYGKMQICFNETKINKSEKELYKNTKEQIDNGFWSKSDSENIINHTIAHEYGHFVERTLIENFIQQNPAEYKQYKDFDSYYEEKSREIRKDIYNIKRTKLADPDRKRVSGYAEDSDPENFAEIFANLVTTKSASNWAKAMKIYLEEKNIC